MPTDTEGDRDTRGQREMEKEDVPFLMKHLEPDRLYSLSQASTTSCPYSTGNGEVREMTPDD